MAAVLVSFTITVLSAQQLFVLKGMLKETQPVLLKAARRQHR
jgi:hypothetical protein